MVGRLADIYIYIYIYVVCIYIQVGGLGCGGFLLQLALEEMEATGAYDYAVVQATESSAGFYDRMGFVRVGALARYGILYIYIIT